MTRHYEPDLVGQAAPPLVLRGGQFPRDLRGGPCGDVHVWENRSVGNATWCSPVIVEPNAMLEVTGDLEVIDHV
jgi:hypothetical protein